MSVCIEVVIVNDYVVSCDRPTESIVPEEVSVYDIKDHPDYKFRPGHVVVRVGGFKVCSTMLRPLLVKYSSS